MSYEEKIVANKDYDIVLTVLEYNNCASQIRLELKHWNHASIGASVRMDPIRVRTLIQSLESALASLRLEETQ